MVEGPGATRNGRKAQQAIGKTVICAEFESKNQTTINSIVSRHLIEAFTVGKELFLIFSPCKDTITNINKNKVKNGCQTESVGNSGTDRSRNQMQEVAMRLHFGMDGTLVIGRNGKDPNVPVWRKSEKCSLRLKLVENSNETEPKFSKGSDAPNLAESNNESSSKSAIEIVDLTEEEKDGSTMRLNPRLPSSSPQNKPFFKNSCTSRFSSHLISPTQNTPKTTVSNPYNIKAQKSSTAHSPNEKSTVMTIEARRTTITFPVSPTTARNKLTRLSCRDSCGPNFNQQNVFDTLRAASISNPNLIISDAILDQDMFPGVGNIIKIESLHRANVDPRRTVSSLLNEELNNVIWHCRDYSLLWLKNGRTPKKDVYNQTVCGTCGTVGVFMRKLGGGGATSAPPGKHAYMSRVTFWCGTCQPPDPPKDCWGVFSGFTSLDVATSAEEFLASDILGNIKNSSETADTISPSIHTNMKRSLSTIGEDLTSSENSINLTTPNKRMSLHSASCRNSSENAKTAGAKPPGATAPPHQQLIYSCPEHGPSTVILRRVKKADSINLNRLFRTCKKQKCRYFAWADSHLPSCKCQRKVILRVSKTEKSGGRWFLCCASGDSRNRSQGGCDFFLWAGQDHLTPLGTGLTPLL